MTPKWTFSRDGMLLWLALAGVVLAYLKSAGNPHGWDFDKWIEFATMLVAWGVGKLQSSPLPSHAEVQARN